LKKVPTHGEPAGKSDLRKKIDSSARGVLLLKAGKGLHATFEESKIQLPTSRTKAALPIFKHDSYLENLEELLVSTTFERSFDFDKFKSSELR